MFFAGEHTCFAFMGYMEGALQSGPTAAISIIAATKRETLHGRARPPARRKRLTSR